MSFTGTQFGICYDNLYQYRIHKYMYCAAIAMCTIMVKQVAWDTAIQMCS